MQRFFLGVVGKRQNVEVILLWLCVSPFRDTVVFVAQDLTPAFFKLLDQLHLGRAETDLF